MASGALRVPRDAERQRPSTRAVWRASLPALGVGIGIALLGCGSQEEPAPPTRTPPEATDELRAENLANVERRASKPRKPPEDLGIEDLAIGDGPACERLDDLVTIHYRGSLLDGREFDSSYERGKPIVAPLDSLIPGWQLGVPGMRVGGRRKLTVPAHLAYSGMAALQAVNAGTATGSGAILIPPESTLIFEIELLAIGDSAPSANPPDIARSPPE